MAVTYFLNRNHILEGNKSVYMTSEIIYFSVTSLVILSMSREVPCIKVSSWLLFLHWPIRLTRITDRYKNICRCWVWLLTISDTNIGGLWFLYTYIRTLISWKGTYMISQERKLLLGWDLWIEVLSSQIVATNHNLFNGSIL